MTNWRIWLRWSWRDLRSRWIQVAVIALIISLGTGVFAGMGGQETWRIESYDLSYSRLNMHDLRVNLADGSFLDQEALLALVSSIEGVSTAEARLITPTLVDASHDDETVLVRGELVGVDVSNGGPHVNSVYVDEEQGRTLVASDAGTNAAVIEYKFARHYDLEPGSPVRISGDVALDFVGAGHSPEYFIIMPETGAFFAEANYAVIFVSLATAQDLTGHDGQANEIVLLLNDGADADAVQAAIEDRMVSTFPETGFDITAKEDDPIYSTLYRDAQDDQVLWNIIALLFLIGATMGAFNLAGRMVEAQRREIGIGMALGLPRRWIAFRPLLVGLQIAVLGTIFGLGIGTLVSQLFANQLEEIAPMPYYEINLYLPGYIRAALLGILLPMLATLLPVWRAVRVQPIEAISTGYLVGKGGGLSWLVNYIPLPGRSFTHMPVKNVLRSPWRTLLTVLGVAIAIAMLAFIVGALDTYVATMDQAEDAFRYQGRDRVLVNLDSFYPVDNGEISAIANLTLGDGAPLLARTETGLTVGGALIDGDTEIDVSLELHDMDDAIWTPELVRGDLTDEGPSIVISEKAAADLDVDIGDSITLEHPLRAGPFSFRFVQSEVTVSGIHNNPMRMLSYMDLDDAALMGLDDTANMLVLEPAQGITGDDIKRALLTQPGVASVEPISDFSEAVENLLSLAAGILGVMEFIVLILAFLIAFNSTSLSVDERVREIATMFAFGLPIRTVTRMQMLENLLIGLAGTLLGVLAGWVTLYSIFQFIDSPELDEIQFQISISPTTLLIAVGLGVVVVALTPILSVRRMRKMDIPSTLRVME